MAAFGKDVGADGEETALSYLLGKTFRPEYSCDVKLDTPGGLKTLRFRLQAMDQSRIDQIDGENRSGEGPFAQLNRAAFNAQMVSEATAYMEDEDGGARVEPDSPEFMGGVPSPGLAMAARFKYQPGLLDGLAEEVRRISGFATERVGSAQKVVASAAGNS